MKILVDTHTHTVLSGHAFSTLIENAAYAKKNGLQAFVDTEHAHTLKGACPDYLPTLFKHMPHEIDGIKVFYGIEANIAGYDGSLDVEEKYLTLCEFVNASLHQIVLPSGTKAQNTAAVIAAIENPYVDVAAHMDRAAFDLDRKAIVLKAKALGKLIEINNHSFKMYPGEQITELIALCKKHDVRIVVSSDAHIAQSVGEVDKAMAAIAAAGLPCELIVNRDIETFCAYLSERKR